MEQPLNKLIFSIVIPCRNEAKFITGCLESILNNGFPTDELEIIVADGESTDRTDNIVRQYALEYSCIRYILNRKRITPCGLNTGILASSGKYVMILGAHTTLNKGYIRKCIEMFDEVHDAACIGGYVEHLPENPMSALIAKAMSHPFGVGNAHFRTGTFEGFVDTVAFGTYRREVFDKIGLFDESLVRNQDDEFSFRMLRNGLKIYLSAALGTKYFVRSSPSKLFKQYYQYGYWKVFVNRKYKAVTTIRQLVPAVFVLFLFIGFLSSIIFPIIFPAYILGLIIYFLAALVSACTVSKNLREILLLLPVFFILHFAYGRGYLAGILRFLILSKSPSLKKTELTR
jgi:glycosyltransferase involved in cell wall biosynthesis